MLFRYSLWYLDESEITELLYFRNITEFIVLDLEDIFEDKGMANLKWIKI
jgi:hypothetical protein